MTKTRKPKKPGGFWLVPVTESMTWLPALVTAAVERREKAGKLTSEAELFRVAMCEYLSGEDPEAKQIYESWKSVFGK